jgi:excisionase family DNA binding protein
MAGRVTFIAPDDLAARWGLDRKTVLAALHRGEIPATRIGRLWRIPETWVLSRENPPPPPVPRRRVRTRPHRG